jgi:hypothetical protein
MTHEVHLSNECIFICILETLYLSLKQGKVFYFYSLHKYVNEIICFMHCQTIELRR